MRLTLIHDVDIDFSVCALFSFDIKPVLLSAGIIYFLFVSEMVCKSWSFETQCVKDSCGRKQNRYGKKHITQARRPSNLDPGSDRSRLLAAGRVEVRQILEAVINLRLWGFNIKQTKTLKCPQQTIWALK